MECPESIEELLEIERMLPLCRKEIYEQAKARIESGVACSISEASRQISEELEKDPESIRRSIQREQQKREGVILSHLGDTPKRNSFINGNILKLMVNLSGSRLTSGLCGRMGPETNDLRHLLKR